MGNLKAFCRKSKNALLLGLALLSAVILLHARSSSLADERGAVEGITIDMVDAMKNLPGGLQALPEVPIPANNPQTPAKIALGKKLFFETRLSGDGTISCATCHAPDKGFSDGLPRPKALMARSCAETRPRR